MRLAAIWLGLLIMAQAAIADPALDRLMTALRAPERLAIAAREGAIAADTLDRDLLNGQGGAVWASQVARIHDPDRLLPLLRIELGNRLTADDIAIALDWLESEPGDRISQLELQAREAFLDPVVAEAAQTHVAETADPQAVDRIIAAGDLVERNVAATLQAQVQFLEGQALRAPEAFDREAYLDALARNADAIRADTRKWLRGYLALAYSPLPPEDVAALLDFAESPGGRRTGAAIFDAFAALNEEIAFAMGQAAALVPSQDDL